VGGSPLPSEGANLLPHSEGSLVLRPQSLHPLPTTGLANLDDHRILTPTHAGVNLFGLDVDAIPHSRPIELQNLLTANRSAVYGTLVARDRQSHEAQVGLTLGIFDDRETHDSFPMVK